MQPRIQALSLSSGRRRGREPGFEVDQIEEEYCILFSRKTAVKQSRMITKLQKTSFQSMGCAAKSSQGKQKYRQRPVFLSYFCTRFPDQFATGFLILNVDSKCLRFLAMGPVWDFLKFVSTQ